MRRREAKSFWDPSFTNHAYRNYLAIYERDISLTKATSNELLYEKR